MDTYIPCAGYLITEGVNPPAAIFALVFLIDLVLIGTALSFALGVAYSQHNYRKYLRPLALVAAFSLAGWMLAGTLWWRVQICEGTETVRGLFLWREQGPGLYMGLLAVVALVVAAAIPRSSSGIVPIAFGKSALKLGSRLVGTSLVAFAAVVNIAGQWWPSPLAAGDFTSPSLLPGLALAFVAVAFVVDYVIAPKVTEETVIDIREKTEMREPESAL